MLKKVIPMVISLCLICSISVMAENTNVTDDETAPAAAEQMPQGERPSGGRGGMPPMGGMPQGEFAPPEGMNGGQRPSGNFTPSQNSGEFVPPQNNGTNRNTETTTPQTDGELSAENAQMPGDNPQTNGQMPGGMGGFPGNMQNFNGQIQEEQPAGFLGFIKTYSTPITSIVLLGLAFIFVIFYRRKNY